MRPLDIKQNQKFINVIVERYMKSEPEVLTDIELSDIMHQSIVLGDISSVTSILFINPSIPQRRHVGFIPRRRDQETFLHTATRNLHPEIVEALISKHQKTDLQSVDYFGYTAFDLAKQIKQDMTNRISPSSEASFIKINRIIDLLLPREKLGDYSQS